jgi:hypothetical protein
VEVLKMKIKPMNFEQPHEREPRKPTEDAIIKWVTKYGRCISPRTGKYGVSYNGKAYLSEDTRALVVMICKDNGIEVEE